ncbi:MAG: glutamyl-tRNA reductase [Pseudomonadales bacterium]|jgi:glutamyl-tRNA reductase|nr:glutamyl-tRNA reductase [Pseudomonadales bacterium]
MLVLGINHNTAPVELREKVAFAPELMQDALRSICNEAGMAEAAILSTCNRTELYCQPRKAELAADEVERRVLAWLCRYHELAPPALEAVTYTHQDDEAVRHLMRVASGLDSMVLGEPQILGQMKSAYAVAQQAATLGTQLNRVFEDVFAVAKQVRTETAIGESPVSVAFAAVTLAQQIFSDIHQASALMIGAGRTIELVVQHLKQAGLHDIVVANRTLTHAQELKHKYGVREVLLADIPKELEHTDIVVSSTASQLPILGKGAVESALRARRHRPIFMVDLAVPRDIEPEVAELDDVYLYTVDDLREVIDSNLRNRQDAAREAELIIDNGVAAFMRKQRGLGIVSTLRSFREKAEQVRDSEVEKALKSLERGQEPAAVVKELARLLTNKLIHSPSVQLKKASADGHPELIHLAEQLFELEASNEAPRTAPQEPPAPRTGGL